MELSAFQTYGVLFLRKLRKRNGWVAGAALADMAGITVEYVIEIMGALIRAGLVRGKKGPGGGYQLVNRRHAASVLEVVDALPEKGRPSEMSATAAEIRAKVLRVTEVCLARMKVDDL
jgi:Rrf2 family protein